MRLVLVWGGAEFGMADASAELCGLEGEDGRNTGAEDYGHGSLFCPCGTKAKNEKTGDGAEANEIKEGSGFFGHILVHFCGDVALLV